MAQFHDVLSALRRMSPGQVRPLADRAGVPIHTVMKIRSGETDNPRVRTVEALAQALASAGGPDDAQAAESAEAASA